MWARFGSGLLGVGLVVGCAASDDGPDDTVDGSVDTGSGDDNDAGVDSDDGQDTDGACVLPDVSSDPTGVRLPYRALTGNASDGVHTWFGIPYAAPPLGDLRFAAPAPPSCETEVLDATTWPDKCLQHEDDGSVVGREDCLYLNVFAPDDADDAPVFVWIHGGGHQQGSSVETLADGGLLYDGTGLAKRGIVVVTVQYRLGPWGFLAHDALDAGTDGNGNWGTLDQLAALQWVQDHIARFGGDPARVTVAGQSAGGVSTCRLAVSPRASGLMSQAMVLSGSCTALPLDKALTKGDDLAEELGCDDATDVAACLRGVSVADWMATYEPLTSVATLSRGWDGVEDGVIVPGPPRERVADGLVAVERVLVGQTEQETGQGVPPVPDEATLRTLLQGYFLSAGVPPLPAWINTLVAEYNETNHGSWQNAWIAASSDAKFVCPTRNDLEAWTEGGATAWRYHFDERLDLLGSAPNNRPFHGADLVWWFERMGAFGIVATAGDKATSADMATVLAHFITEGDPNPDMRDWSAWDVDEDNAWVFSGGDGEALDGVHTDGCDAWASLVP